MKIEIEQSNDEPKATLLKNAPDGWYKNRDGAYAFKRGSMVALFSSLDGFELADKIAFYADYFPCAEPQKITIKP